MRLGALHLIEQSLEAGILYKRYSVYHTGLIDKGTAAFGHFVGDIT